MNSAGTREPLDIPAAWRGRELLGRPDWQITLEAKEIDELLKAIQPVLESGRPWQETSRGDYEMPSLARRLADIQRDVELGSGAAMIKGFPVDLLDEEQAMFCRRDVADDSVACGAQHQLAASGGNG